MTTNTTSNVQAHSAAAEQFIALDQLVTATTNVRKTAATQIDALADNIAANGLLHNLVVTPQGKKFGVVAGSRRLAALKLLAKQNRLAADAPVACRMVDKARAVVASLSENTQREAMHPLDELAAWKALADAGADALTIATQYGVTPGVVSRRLKLANVSPKLLELLRTDDIEMGQLMALAITDDHAAQEAVWESAPQWSRGPGQLRAALTNDAMASTDPLVRFVTVEAYIEAGGAVTEDLFAVDENGVTTKYLADGDLLMSLAEQKLQPVYAEYTDQGWGWCEFSPGGSGKYWQLQRLTPKARKKTPTESKTLAQLEAQHEAAKEALWAAEEEGKDTPDEQIDALEADYDRTEQALEAFNDALLTYPKKYMGVAGVYLTLNQQGGIESSAGWIKPEHAKAYKRRCGDKKKVAGNADSDTTAQAQEDAAEDVDQDNALSGALRRRLTAHRSGALQVAVANNPVVALRALVAHLVQRSGLRERDYSRSDSGLNVQANESDDMASHASDFPESRACALMAQLVGETEAKVMVPPLSDDDTARRHDPIQFMEVDDLLQVLALMVARTVSVVEHNGRSAGPENGAALCRAVGLDMSAYWQPTADSYFRFRTRSQLLHDIGEFAPDAISGLTGLKKSDLAAKAEKLVQGTGWLPPILREPDAIEGRDDDDAADRAD